MSIPCALEPPSTLAPRQRALAVLVVAIARPLAAIRPGRLRRILEFARRGARPATPAQALAARRAVATVSLRCAGQGCLQRSIAAALYCRAHGGWPTWCTGVRTQPFAAHAWIEVDSVPIGELHPAGHYRTLISIPAAGATPTG